MGATAVSEFIIGKFKTPSEAFHELCEDARDQYGNDTYNGKINNGEYQGAIKKFPYPGSQAFRNFCEKFADNCEKGDVYSIEYTGAALKRKKDASRWKGKKGVRAFRFIGSVRY